MTSSRPRTLFEILERAGAASEQLGVRFCDRREQERFVSWREVRERAGRAAAALCRAGVEPGDRVALAYPTSPEFVTAFFGAVAAGAVPVPIAPPLRLGRLEEYLANLGALLEASGPRLLLAEPRLATALAGAEFRAVEVGDIDSLTATVGPAAAPDRPTAAPDDLALLQFSSGTTAAPKPVALTHRALVSQVEILNDQWPDQGGVVHGGVSWLPLHHDMGLVGFLLSALWRPASLTLLQPEVFAARPALWLRAIARHRATISAAPSFGYALCVEKVSDEEMEGVDLSSWRIALNGAETVAADTLEAFERRFARFGFRPTAMTPVYGLAEATLALTFARPDERPRVVAFSRPELEAGVARLAAAGEAIATLVSLGGPLRGMAIEIRAPDRLDTALGEGRVGEVFARSPSLMSGYYGQPEETRQSLRSGWLDTGDRGFLWNGELFLTGRSKDLIIVRGRNVAPETIELAASRVAGVRGDGVAAVGEAAARETVTLFVERDRQTGEAEEERIAAETSAAALTAAGVLPDTTVVLPSGSLPRTTSGKVRRQEALRRWREGTLARRAG